MAPNQKDGPTKTAKKKPHRRKHRIDVQIKCLKVRLGQTANDTLDATLFTQQAIQKKGGCAEQTIAISNRQRQHSMFAAVVFHNNRRRRFAEATKVKSAILDIE